jgi:hypothetical protein
MIAAIVLLPMSARAQDAPRVGDTIQILRQHQISQRSEGSSSTSSNSDGFVERVAAVRPDGLELEYDLPQGSGGGSWQFPARVLKPTHGPMRLLDPKAMEARVDAWLKQAGMTRAACGHWVSGWSAFRVECDPQSVLTVLNQLNPDAGALREGASYRDPEARGPAPLVRKSATAFTVELAADPEKIRRARADADIANAELSGERLASDAALRAHADEAISGTITIGFDLDSAGQVRRRTRIIKVDIKRKDGRVENQTETEIVERRPAPRPPRDPNLI